MNEYTQNLSIKAWAEDDRPREKLLRLGRQSLTDAELLAILIRSGTKNFSAVELSKKILNESKNNLNELARVTVNDFLKFPGMGEAKALSIVAALELGRRRNESDPLKRDKIVSSRDSFEIIRSKFLDIPHEEFWILLVDRSGHIIEKYPISMGGVHGTVADVRIIFKHAIEKLASGIILCHNHPSGNLQPSGNDIELTKKLVEVGKVMEIPILDHLIVTNTGYYSFADEGKL